ncbi:ThiF family adenylyltransferase [Microbacterium sp. MPKO10]|uniref:ThiF family adenylyltransferase n=1 Tax=Microbacterium sp. MPKO10 TaxID=2989818 RepID=UPI00223698D3|nr:ThiF family adenylyltransferase [Microbacterium sp. MPKO10]MCW4458045.1 ThiF family adenylyltransferase [Microbacterium sp. MPKO10]
MNDSPVFAPSATPAAAGALPPLVEPGPSLSRREIDRYARHLALPDVGSLGQRRLRHASVLVIGAGGLGAPILHYLAAAGIGHLTVIDDDVVEASNLQRQVLHRDEDIGRPKAESAHDALVRLDPTMSVSALCERLTPENAIDLFTRHDLVLDGTDNFATRYLSNDAAELTGTPLVWGTIFRFAGQVSTFWPGRGPMLRDLFPDIPDADSVPDCAAGGVLGVLCGTVGSAMATEAVKLICGIGSPLIGRLLRYDALTSESSTLRFAEDPGREPVTSLAEVAAVCSAASTRADAADAQPGEITVTALAALLTRATHIEELAVVDVRESWERELAAIPGSVHVPLERVQSDGWSAVARACGPVEKVVLYCASGVRSARACERLADDVPAAVALHSLAGGIDAWNREV